MKFRIPNLLLLFTLITLPLQSVSAEQVPANSTFSQNDFALVLTKHVKDGIVDYPNISNDQNYLQYLQRLQQTTKLPNQTESLAYWINAYNALAIKGILDGRSPESFFGKVGYFYNAEYQVNGINTNLYSLEHDIIIPLNEPRIHFALNCASASCPKLSNKPYIVETLETQLEQAAISFINDPTRNRFDKENKIAYLSKIFDWFEDDFTNYAGSVQHYLALYVNDATLSNALASEEYSIEYLEYDWSLNGIAPVIQD